MPTSQSTYDVARSWAGFALLGAGLVHLAEVRTHLDLNLVHGSFFVAVGAAQVGVGLMSMARRVPAPRVVVAGQLAVLAVWALSRTVGLPVGPEASTAEAVGRADLLAVGLGLVAVTSILVGNRAVADAGRRVVRPARYLAAVGAGAVLVAGLTTPALAATEAGEHARPHGHHGSGH